MIPNPDTRWRRNWDDPHAPIYTVVSADLVSVTYSFRSTSTSRTRRGRYRNSVQYHLETVDISTWNECFSPGDQIILPSDGFV